ncbi:MAG: DMT family transporter [Alphaproteobacteria bacterium]
MASAPTTPEHSSLTGMILAAAAFGLLTAVDTIFKYVSLSGYSSYQILFINAIFALIPILTWTMMTGGLVRLRTTRPMQHMARGATSVMSAFAAIYAYTHIPLTNFYAIVFAGPLLVTIMSAFWLNEKVDNARWLAIVVGFMGIMIVANPFDDAAATRNTGVLAGRFAAFISVFCYALSAVVVRRMRLGETNMTFAFYGYISCILITALFLLLRGGIEMHFKDVMHLALSGTLAGISSICLMTAYHRTPVALVAPFQYTQIIWGAISGYLIWSNIPSFRLLVGAGVVATCGLFVIYREMRVSGRSV